MKKTAQLLNILIMAVICVFVTSAAFASDAIKTIPNIQSSKQPSSIQPITHPYKNPIPAAPAGLTAISSMGGIQVILNWKGTSLNAQFFIIQRKIGHGSYEKINETPANITTAIDTNVNLNTTYTYRIQAYNDAGYSPFSNEAIITVKPASAESGEIIQCPDMKGKSLLLRVNPQDIPAGWTFTNQSIDVKYFFSAVIFDGKLSCSYYVREGVYMDILRPFPTGKTCNSVEDKYFTCQ